MKNNPFFSIIIPTFNREATILACIESVLFQSFSDFEIIVVDDGSTDMTSKIVNQLGVDKIIYKYQENFGVSKARNVGAQLAKGHYLIFLDSDDELYEDCLACLFKKLQKKQDNVILFGHHLRNDENIGPRLDKKFFGSIKFSSICGSYVVSRSLFIRLGGYKDYLTHSENWEFMLRVLKYQRPSDLKILYVECVLVTYNRDIDLNKFIHYKEKKIKSYSFLWEKEKDKRIYTNKMLDYFALVVASNYAGLGDFKNTICWIKRMSLKALLTGGYIKPIFIFTKRKIFKYR